MAKAFKISIKELSADTEQLKRWDEYVAQHENASFFHRAGWKQVIEQAFGHKTCYLFAECDDAVVGVLPLAHIKSLIFGNMLTSTPFCVSGGVIASSDEARKMLERAAIELAQRLAVDSLEMRYESPMNPDWPNKSDLYVSFKKEIDPDVEKNMLNIPRKQRAMVRKGIKAGLKSEWQSDIDCLYDAYSQSVHALGTPVFSKNYFSLLKEVFADDCRILTISQNGKLVSSVMSFYFRGQVLPYYGGGTPAARQCWGSDFMYWELMRLSCEQGISVFDYGRSKVGTGSYRFKKNWGFEPVPLYYEYFLVTANELPNVSPTNPKYQMFIKAWKKMPLWMSRAIGPHIVKYTG